jgi:hypothetical protein
MGEPTPEEIERLHIDYERGFYVEFRNGKLHAGREPIENVRVIEV